MVMSQTYVDSKLTRKKFGTKFPFYEGLADKSIDINKKDLSNKKSEIKNSDNYKGGFFDVPI